MTLTISYITSRREPKVEWFLDSLSLQTNGEDIPIIYVSPYFDNRVNAQERMTSKYKQGLSVTGTKPKPSVWQGEHRLTKQDWWAKSNAMNTAICLCHTEWIAFVDDRCVLAPQWLACVKEAMEKNYAVCGSYEKRANMKVENGVVTDHGEILGVDTRPQYDYAIPTRDWYGGSCALPLEWCLAVNGFSEDLCDGLGSEDSMFGVTLRNNNFPMYFDARMRIIEDRTPSEIDGALKRADKDVHLGNRAKSWMIVRALYDKKDSQNSYDIRNMRDRILLNHEPFPPPSASDRDWYDGQLVSEME